MQENLYLGNLDAKRDWGHARDYAEGMWRILQQAEADDFILGTGESHSVREFVELAFREVGIRVAWRGRGMDETGIDAASQRVLVKIDRRYFRPTEVDHLVSDPSKARQQLGWRHTVSFKELVTEMVQADVETVKLEAGRRNRAE